MSVSPAKIDQVRTLLAQGRVAQARAACARLAQAHPRDAGPAAMLAEIAARSNQPAQSAHWASRAADLAPHDAELLWRAGWACYVVDRRDAAERYLRACLGRDARRVQARSTLASLLAEGRRFTEMERLVREGLEVSPDEPELVALRAGAWLNLGRAGDAAALLRDAQAAHPDNASLAAGLAMVLNYVPGVDPEDVVGAHRRFGELLARAVGPACFDHRNERNADRALRVGIVSPDLRRHSVAWFIEPVLRHHDRSRLCIMVYQTNFEEDEVTARLRPLAAFWRVMDRATDEDLARQVHADGIDILLDLSGLTQGHSLAAFQRRPAPVQVTYLGYPATTGLRAIDYRLVDTLTDPAGSEALAVERLLRVEGCFVCYQPPEDAPDVRVRGAGPVAFGSFNSAQKLSDWLLHLWARVLESTPGSRLILKAVNFEDAPLRAEIAARFARVGGDPDRLEVRSPHKDRRDHLAAYAEIDVALDPAPYCGTTTTCEALWMGVPVVTLAGRSHAGRVGVSLLNAVGRSEWIARDEDHYVRLASALATNRERLARERGELREAMRRSVLCDGPGFCVRFEKALRGAWRAWCVRDGPERGTKDGG
jgi:protein O-GlcNAc transferase